MIAQIHEGDQPDVNAFAVMYREAPTLPDGTRAAQHSIHVAHLVNGVWGWIMVKPEILQAIVDALQVQEAQQDVWFWCTLTETED